MFLGVANYRETKWIMFQTQNHSQKICVRNRCCMREQTGNICNRHNVSLSGTAFRNRATLYLLTYLQDSLVLTLSGWTFAIILRWTYMNKYAIRIRNSSVGFTSSLICSFDADLWYLGHSENKLFPLRLAIEPAKRVANLSTTVTHKRGRLQTNTAIALWCLCLFVIGVNRSPKLLHRLSTVYHPS